ncbi:MAG: galactokinase [Planctomycetaceae bacterium]|nr:galactokinase [Planctomycetaceae bacterium]
MSTSDELEARAIAAFKARFGTRPTSFGSAPGRVELLGNHTDYNGGLVMAVAIDRFTLAVGRPVSGQTCRVHTLNFDSDDAFDLGRILPGGTGDWTNYVKGVIWAIQDALGPSLNSGFDLAVAGNVPMGTGLSSSASLAAAVAFFLLQAGLVPGRPITRYQGEMADPARMDLAKVLRQSENDFVGVGSGLLDYFSCLFARAHHALFLDCQTLRYDRLPLGEPGPAIIVCNSGTTRRLSDSMYNLRRAECESIVGYFQAKKKTEPIASLRDITLDELVEHWDRLDPVARKRARHVLTENERVWLGVLALRAGELAEFGRLISASHASSRDDFENSSPALDALIEAAQAAPGFLGGKLSGAGWAGCIVNVVLADQADAFAESVRTTYARKLGVTPEIHICQAAGGALGGEPTVD